MAAYRSNERACEQSFRGLPLSDITRKVLAEHVSRRKLAGVSDATIRRDLALLRSLQSMAVCWEWAESNPVIAMASVDWQWGVLDGL